MIGLQNKVYQRNFKFNMRYNQCLHFKSIDGQFEIQFSFELKKKASANYNSYAKKIGPNAVTSAYFT